MFKITFCKNIRVNNSCAKQSFLDEFKKAVTNQLDALARRQKELEASLQIQTILDRQNVRMKSTDDRLNDLSENIVNNNIIRFIFISPLLKSARI